MEHLSTAQAAELADMSPATFRREVNRALRRGIELKTPASDWPDRRTPRYDAEKVRTWTETRMTRRKPTQRTTEAPR